MATLPEEGASWQAEADLLADGRDYLEGLTGSFRIRHLYPRGTNLAVLLEAYRELRRLRTIGRVTTTRPRRLLRRFRRLIRARFRRDTLERSRRLLYGYPAARLGPLVSPLPPLALRALASVDADARDEVEGLITGSAPAPAPSASTTAIGAGGSDSARLQRGLDQLRRALINESLAHPAALAALHPQLLRFARSPLPTERRHPVATLFFVKLPIYAWLTFLLIFNVAYFGAWWLFNDETLARFLGPTVTAAAGIDGDLEFESIHWQPRLIIDLITGTPTPVHVEGLKIYEGHRYLGQPRRRLVVAADAVDVAMVVHEIIPLNRLGVPPVFEIPWVLHFTEVHSAAPIKVWAREYAVEARDGTTEWRLSLPAAFGPGTDDPVPEDTRGISIRVDKATLDDLTVDVDMRSRGRWQDVMHMREVAVTVALKGHHPKEPPERLQLQFDLSALVDEGELDLLSLGDDGYRIPIRDLQLRSVRAGVGDVPIGDLKIEAEGAFAGSPVAIHGLLSDYLGDATRVDLDLGFSDVGDFAGLVSAAHGLPPSMIGADGVAALLSIRGPLSDPTLHLAAEGLTIRVDDAHPGWVVDDADVALALRSDPVPEPWEGRFPAGAERWMVDIEEFDAQFLGGPISVREHAIPTRVVLPAGDDSAILVTADINLDGVDPGILFGDAPANARTLQGALHGRLAVPQMVVEFGDEMTITHLEADLDELSLTRDHGPQSDGLPRVIGVDGGLIYDRDEGVTIDDVIVTINGGRLAIDGGLDRQLRTLRPTVLELRVSDGAAFLREFAVGPYFDRLSARLSVHGPTSAPDGSDGSLTISGVGKGDVLVTGIDQARLWMERGELHLRSQNIALLGGRGRLAADLGLFAGGELSDDPKLKVSADLSGIELGRVSGGLVAGKGDIQIEVGDPAGNPAPISKFQARGALYVGALTVGDATFRDAETKFELNRERLRLLSIRLAYHRKVSPRYAPDHTLPMGELSGSGTVSFASDPELALSLKARGLPLSLLASAIDYPDPPFGGQVSDGTSIEIHGTVARPALQGTVMLSAMSAAGIPLGRGKLELSTADMPASGGLAARREVSLAGTFRARRDARVADERLSWSVDGTIAFGQKPRRGSAPFAASVAANFKNLPIANLLHGAPLDLASSVAGQFEGLRVNALTCDPRQHLIDACRGDFKASSDLGISIDMELDKLWVRERDGKRRGDDPCLEATSLCSQNRLRATLEGSSLRLRDPWVIRTGGPEGRELTITGEIDLSEPPPVESSDKQECLALARSALARSRSSDNGSLAQLRGEFALAALTPFVKALGVSAVAGKVGVDLGIRGHISAPVISGVVDVPTAVVPMTVKLGKGSSSFGISVPELAVRIAGDHVFAAGSVTVLDQRVEFGDFTRDGREATYYALSGPCGGNFAVAAQGTVDGKMVAEYLPDVFTRGSGSLEISNALISGHSGEGDEGTVIDALHLEVAPGTDTFRGALNVAGVDPFEITRGSAELVRCSTRDPCPDNLEGYAAFIGGRSGAAANSAPSSALRLKIGDRGRATAWGHVVVTPELDRIADSSLHVALDEVGYRQFDNSGRPELLATLSSESLLLEGRDTMILRGEVVVERSRWIRDAQEGVRVLSFADPSTAPEAPPPAIIRDLALDLRVRTTAPFRVDNNVMKGVEGQVALSLGGTVADLDLAGRIDVGTGVLDLSILGSAFDIQYGKVLLEHDLEDSQVDVLAVRQEPIYINGQPRQMSVRLTGTLDAINMRCIVQGDTASNRRSTRECVDYLVLGAGNQQIADVSGVRRTGGGGLLGKPIGLVGSLTELKLERYIQDSAPRAAPFVPDISMRLGQYGIEVEAETPRPWFRSEWGNLSVGAGYTRGYPGLLLRNSYNWRVRLQILDSATLELRDSKRSYFNERIIFDPLRQRSLELRLEHQLPSLR